MPFSNESTNFMTPDQGCQWIDSHCHFDFEVFDADRDAHWALLQKFGCAGLVIPGVTAASWAYLVERCTDKPWGFALGLHPYFLDQHQEGDLQRLEDACLAQLARPDNASHLIAVGEFGLDLMLAEPSHKAQAELCQQQLLIASRLHLPVIIHVRKAYDEMAAMIRRLGFTQGGIVHSFSGSYQQGMALVELGFKLGVGGAMSHPRAKKLRATISRLPLSSLVLETDAPDMKPAFWQGPDNSPLSLLLLAQIVASLHDSHLDEVLFSSNNNVLMTLPKMKPLISSR
jgi:TatD DNase family protein